MRNRCRVCKKHFRDSRSLSVHLAQEHRQHDDQTYASSNYNKNNPHFYTGDIYRKREGWESQERYGMPDHDPFAWTSMSYRNPDRKYKSRSDKNHQGNRHFN